MFQEVKAEYNEQILKLEATIACLRSEIESEKIIKEEGDLQMDELMHELDKVNNDMDGLREDHTENLKKIREKFEAKLKLLEHKSEKLAAENFEYVVENV